MGLFDKDIAQINRFSACVGSCGLCAECQRKASMAAASHVIDRCADQRRHRNSMKEQQKRYLRNQLIFLLAALGIADGDEVRELVARSDRGMAMRRKQTG